MHLILKLKKLIIIIQYILLIKKLFFLNFYSNLRKITEFDKKIKIILQKIN